MVFGGSGVRGLGFGLNCRADWSMRASNKFVHTLSGSGFRVASLVFLVSVARFLFSGFGFQFSGFAFRGWASVFQRPIARLSLNCDARNRSPIRNLRTETSNPTTETSNPTLATQNPDPERVSTSSSLALVILFGGWAWVSSVPAADSAPFFELHSMYYGEYGVARFVREGGRRERERGREREREALKHTE